MQKCWTRSLTICDAKILNRRTSIVMADDKFNALMKAANEKLNADRARPIYNCTDVGNGERFAAQHRSYARWCQKWKQWLVYDTKRWQKDSAALIMRLAKDTALSIFDEARDEASDERRKKLAD